jgi:hypothetical protein
MGGLGKKVQNSEANQRVTAFQKVVGITGKGINITANEDEARKIGVL